MSATASAPGIQAPVSSTWIPPFARVAKREPLWNVAFVGILGYLVVEYTRLAAMYPVLIPLQLGKVTVLAALVGLLFSPGQRVGLARQVRTLDLAVAFFAFAALLSAVMAHYEEPAWEYFSYGARWGVMYLLISRVVNNSRRLRVFIFLLLLLNFKLAQFVLRSYNGAVEAGKDEMMLMVRGVGAGSTGFFSNSADFGVAMCVVWPIAVALLFCRPKGMWKLLLPAGAVVFLASILVCGSRGAVVGASAVALVAWVRSSRKLVAAVMVLLLLAGIAFVYPDASKERMHSAWNWEQDKTASARVHLWKHGWGLFLENPLLGVGPGNFAATRGAQYLSETVTHSIYLEALSEYGLLGTLPVIVLVLAFFVLNSHTRRALLRAGPERQQSFEYGLATGLDLAMIGFLASGAFVSVLLYPHMWILVALSVGLNAAVARMPEPSKATELQPARQKLAVSW